MLVLDASVALASVLPDETSAGAAGILRQVGEEGAIVPAVWPLEVLNALIVAERRGRLSRPGVDKALSILLRFPIRIVTESPESVFSGTRDISRRHKVSAYDASYLDLARRNDVPLATFDSRLRRAATALGVELAGRD